MENPSDTSASGSLDERKLQYDAAAKTRELDLREREVTSKEREVASKEKELERSRWLNPTVIGIFVAAIGLISSVVVARLNNNATQDLERQRAQSTIILEAIRTGTGNTDASCRNLLFLANLRLLDDPRQTISKQCSSVSPGLPSLPSAGEVARFTRSAQLTPEIEATLKQTLVRYREYLSKLGIQPPVVPEVVVVDEATMQASECYHACDVEDKIYLLAGFATPALVVHEFTHTVFIRKIPGEPDRQWSYSAIEAGMANFLTADFLDSPVIDNKSLDSSPRVSFTQIPHDWNGGQGPGGIAWGEFLWRLRGQTGADKDRVTKAAVHAFAALHLNDPPDDYEKEFLRGLVASGLEEAQVRSALPSPKRF